MLQATQVSFALPERVDRGVWRVYSRLNIHKSHINRVFSDISINTLALCFPFLDWVAAAADEAKSILHQGLLALPPKAMFCQSCIESIKIRAKYLQPYESSRP